MGCHALLQGVFLNQRSNLSLISTALAGRFFTTSTTWEAPFKRLKESQLIGRQNRHFAKNFLPPARTWSVCDPSVLRQPWSKVAGDSWKEMLPSFPRPVSPSSVSVHQGTQLPGMWSNRERHLPPRILAAPFQVDQPPGPELSMKRVQSCSLPENSLALITCAAG